MDALARSWKVLVLLVAALGAWAFFQPFYVYPAVDHFEVSAYRILVGYETFDEAGGPERFGFSRDELDTEQARRTLRDLNEWVKAQEVGPYVGWSSSAKPSKSFVPWYFLTVAILCAVAFYSFVERKLRNGAAWVVVVSSLPALWGFSRAWRAMTGANGLELGLGAWLLGATGVLAMAVGIASMIREDPGGFFKGSPTDDDEIVEELEDPYGRRTRRDPRDR